MAIGRRRRGSHRHGRVPFVPIGVGLLVGIVALLWATLRGGPTPKPPSLASVSSPGPDVRVRLGSDLASVGVILDGVPKTIRASDVPADAPTTLVGTPSRPVGFSGKRYRGTIRLVRNADALDVINVVPIDDYLRGVVSKEAAPGAALEALKAQAVASRTYGLYQAQLRKNDSGDRAFDLRADTASQAYGGIEAETDLGDQAVEATRGVVLTSGPPDRPRIFSAFFSATCGGATASGADIFDDPTPALAAHAGDGCAEATKARYRWPDFSIAKAELLRRVKLWGTRQSSPIAAIDSIRGVEVARANEFGRPVRYAVIDGAGRRFELNAEHFRNAFNTSRPDDQPELWSSWFTPVDDGDRVKITDGHGFGHGVGMCQNCAAVWAKRGWSSEQILEASYPGAKLERAY